MHSISTNLYKELTIAKLTMQKSERVVLTHLGLPQLQLQLSGLHYHGMCAPLLCVINPYAVN